MRDGVTVSVGEALYQIYSLTASSIPALVADRRTIRRPSLLIRLAAHRSAVQEFVTTCLATSTGGVLTGRGADITLTDDPLKPEEALSKALRQACNEWFVHTLYSRLNDKRHGAIVIIIQRLHEDDLVGAGRLLILGTPVMTRVGSTNCY